MSTGPTGRTTSAGRRPEQDPDLSTRIDGELLRVVAHAVLLHIDQLTAEGLHRVAAEKITRHALALTSTTADLAGHPAHQRTHGLGLGEVLAVLTGPASTTLLRWLDDALDPAP